VSDSIDSPDTFDADYVKSIRQESAKYRTQVKDLKSELEGYKGLEAQLTAIRIENEFIRRGIKAEPQWVQIQEGETPSAAVDGFLEKYPQFAGGSATEAQEQEETKVEPKSVPKAMSPKPTNTREIPQRSLDEIKQDPSARSNLTDLYRDLLKTSSNQKD
jgi:hypothetical protein